MIDKKVQKAFQHAGFHAKGKTDAKHKALEKKKGKKEYDSLAHLKDEKTGYYDLKLHSKKK